MTAFATDALQDVFNGDGAIEEGEAHQRRLEQQLLLRAPSKPWLQFAERGRSLEWLAGLHDANWSAAYTHPKMGDFTAASMLCAWVAHDLLHLRQIERILFERLKRSADPDRTDYAGEW